MGAAVNPTWIIENYTKEKSFLEMVSAVRDSGSPLIEIKDDYSKSIFKDLTDTGRLVLNGSISMLKILREDIPNRWAGIRVPTFENYLCSRYYGHFGDLLFNDRYMLMQLGELARQRWMVYGVLGADAKLFIRPDSGEKPFPAQLIDMQDLDEFCRVHPEDMQSLCLVSSPKNIWWEGRFVCHQSEIIAHTTYKLKDVLTQCPSVPKEAEECCRRVLDRNYRPDEVFCVDICGCDGKFYLLELNAFSSSGLYACDKRRLVDRVNSIVNSMT